MEREKCAMAQKCDGTLMCQARFYCLSGQAKVCLASAVQSILVLVKNFTLKNRLTNDNLLMKKTFHCSGIPFFADTHMQVLIHVQTIKIGFRINP